MGDHEMLKRLQDGETIHIDEFTSKYDPVTRLILEKRWALSFRQIPTKQGHCFAAY